MTLQDDDHIWVDFFNLVLLSKLLNHFLCSDTDECTDHAHDCHVNALCTNSEGNYTCTCKDGYDGDGKNCTGKFERYISLIIINTVICQMIMMMMMMTMMMTMMTICGVKTLKYKENLLKSTRHFCFLSILFIRTFLYIIIFFILSICFIFLDHVDACVTNMHGCHYNASCIITNGSYICTCKPGLNCSKYDLAFQSC